MPEKTTESAVVKKTSASEPVVWVRINAQVTDAEHQKLKVHAAQHRTTISELLRNFIATLKD